MAKVKEDLQAFREMYTLGDVIRAFEEACGEWIGDVIAVDIDAFPGGYFYSDRTHFTFRAVTSTYSTIREIWFYTDMELAIHSGTWTVDKFERGERISG